MTDHSTPDPHAGHDAPEAEFALGLGPALRARVRDQRPDLEHLAHVSLRAGRSSRRRRRLGAAAGGVVGAAALAVAAGALSGGATTARDATVAATPTPSATATVTVPPGEAPANEGVGTPVAPSLPFTLDLAGWTCDYFPVDDKALCTGPDGAAVSVVVRPASEHASWAGRADKGADPTTLWTSPVHGDYFLTIQDGDPGLGATPLTTLVDALTLAPRWERP